MPKVPSGTRVSGTGVPNLRRNTILAALPESLWMAWEPQLELIDFEVGTVVFEVGAPLHYVWFPLECAIAVMQTLADGACSQIAVVGREGLVGAPVFLGAAVAPTRAIVQSPGLAARIAPHLVVAEFARGDLVMRLLLRHTQAVIAQMGQIAACNRHHSPEQQFCRWLLMALDRVDGSELHVTQEFIASMLGVRRETINEVARKLQARGILQGRRGSLEVLDRRALERCTCECYFAVMREYARLFPQQP